MNIRDIITEDCLEQLFSQANLGLEKEGHRVILDAEKPLLATSTHPNNLGDRSYHPYIQTDFAESQLELITPAVKTEKELYRILQTINEVTLRALDSEEYIWPISIPPELPKEESIKIVQLKDKKQKQYRQYLSEKYGKHKQLLSGIHYNFSFTDSFLLKIAESSDTSLTETKNDLYMKVARQFLRYQWLLVYLYGCTPYIDEKYFDYINKYEVCKIDEKPTLPVRSLRVSKYGYVNEGKIQISFNSLEEYVANIENYVANKDLIEEKEFYSAVRLKGSSNAREFLEKGIQYLELRIFDINPFSPTGIALSDIRFIHLFTMLMSWLDETNPNESAEVGKAKNELVALSHPLQQTEYLDEGKWLFTQMLEMSKILGLPEEDIEIIKEKQLALHSPELTLAGQIYKHCNSWEEFQKFTAKITKEQKEAALEKPYQLTAFSHMELSTQALISDAIQHGIEVEILDESDQFVKLTYKDHVEYVKNGNMTSKDTYISPLIMDNKVVTKIVLEEQGFNVPKSVQCSNLQEAKNIYRQVKNKAVVIKPKSTNFGLGITIFSNPTYSETDFIKAVEIALKEDKEIMIEDYLVGEEYRFFVLGNDTKAVLSRVPANITGNGINTIKELVNIKNEDSLRGDGLSSPLKKIALGELEKLHLKTQGYDENTIPDKGEKIFLRANSNISTGGDSIDFTDKAHESYKNVAAKIANALQAKICGVDLIIPDINKPLNHENSYGVVEANYNPMMMMHIFPYQGKSRRLTTHILEFLYPEKDWDYIH
ncbi:bifunctional glutamate--cysteine ligase GshA/glutathione synthetase GshB [Actinomyces sp. zg-332]|uniref:bifunctional glutamate--cysteine ligase GshA/glutathione synthetase GshB n=1 Tax=Actinomyces sp. zg-332 TaxID=2708340 RepID=UPI00142157A1|nr:bifunctional glutamate--cysteine ligase GshA/glutathione synthetase GshB [Actinomyces sp. zg-332]QPK94361.1 bifunctional glutamate--cysteine ligase GshA/glutathione synthetase GshB [Actinomyces sp. zg-332]